MTSLWPNQRRLYYPGQTIQQLTQRRPPTSSSSDRLLSDQIDFYLNLILYSIISPFKTKHSVRGLAAEISGDLSELRRDFLDKLSYLCDIDKSGATVTAAAMQQKTRVSKILWLAANEHIRTEVKEFVDLTMQRLQAVNVEKSEDTANAILQDAVGKGQKRILFYRTKMMEFARKCRDELDKLQEDEGAKGLRPWIRKLIKSGHGVDWCGLVTLCYAARGQELSSLHIRADATPKKDDGTNCYTELAHYVGRLGAHAHAVRVIVKAALRVPSIKQITQIQYEEASNARRVFLPPGCLNAYQIVKRICVSLDATKMAQYMLAFFQQDLVQDFDHKLQEHPLLQAGNMILTRVHAEILLADLFSRRGWKCVDDDKYIGCSKGACFCCASYLNLHHFGFVTPASHNKVILGWRGPEANPLLDKNRLGEAKLLLMEKKMNRSIEDNLLESLVRPGNRISFQHLSTNGSSRESSVVAIRSLDRRQL